MRPVTLVDYGMGNLLSVERAFRKCGVEVEKASTPEQLERADVVVLPGVGAFADGMAGLRQRGFVDPLREHVAAGRPLLAICLGMHMLFEWSSEFGDHAGLGILPGAVIPLPRSDASGRLLKTPHIGWNPLRPVDAPWEGTVLGETPKGDWFYFVHSFAARPADKAHRLADIEYGGESIPAVVAAGSIVGTQFHPEKSGPAGLRLISSFLAAAHMCAT